MSRKQENQGAALAASGPGVGPVRRRLPFLGALAATLSLALLAGANPARATTTGNTNGNFNGIVVLNAFGIPIDGFNAVYGATTSTGVFGYVLNDYIGVVQGIQGSTTIGTITHNHGGMIAIGNTKGSLIYTADDTQGLVGLNFEEFYDPTTGKPSGIGQYPIPGYWTSGTGLIQFDYPAYLRANIDGVITPIVGNTLGSYITPPSYINGVLTSLVLLLAGTGTVTGTPTTPLTLDQTPGLLLRQDINLFRATAQFHWTLRNNDTIGHQVSLRFTLPVRGLQNGEGFNNTHAGFVFLDPVHGNLPSNYAEILQTNQVGDDLTFYGARQEVDNIAAPPYASRVYLRNTNRNLPTDPTLPTQVFVADSIELRPETANFDPQISKVTFQTGVSVGLYYNNISLAPGEVRDVYAYFGNGQPSENLRTDVAIGAEATESLGFDSTAAANTLIPVQGNTTLVTDANAQAAARRAFLSPRPLPIYGDVFNRKISLPLNSIYLTNVSLALNLPTGLSFTTNPNTGVTDTASRTIGTLGADTDSVQQWYTQADGTVYGTLNYQVVASATEISARAVTRSITVPAEPLYPVTSQSYQLLGLPFDFDPTISNNANPATIVNALAPLALRDQNTFFYQYAPDPQRDDGLGTYRVVTKVLRGLGYFYKPDLTRTIFAAGALPSANQADAINKTSSNLDTPTTAGQIQLNLARGWNMISNPYVYQIPLSYLRLLSTDSGGIGDPANGGQTLLDAVQSGLVQGTLWTYDTTTQSYSPVDLTTAQLEPWKGYYIKLASPVVLVYSPPTTHNSVILPDPISGNIPATRAADRSLFSPDRLQLANATPQEWRQQFVAVRGDGKQDRSAVIGVSRSVKASLASLSKPPAPMNSYVYTSLTDAAGKSRFAQMLHAPATGGAQRWNLDVVSDSDGPVTLQWPGITRSLPRTVGLSLQDPSTGQTFSLRSLSSLKVDLKKDVAHRFVVIASDLKSNALSITNVRSVHNTTRAAQGFSGYEFAFNLSKDAEVSGTVQTLSGRTVARLATGRAAHAGDTRLTWNGRGADGSALAPGAYLVEIEARDSDGVRVTQKVPFMSLR